MNTTDQVPEATSPIDALIVSSFKNPRQQIAEMKAFSDSLAFDYEDKNGNREARSHIAKLRTVNAAIEACRKGAKADAIEFGRKVDGAANELKDQVAAMIDVHAIPVKRIEERMARHEAALAMCRLEGAITRDSAGLLSIRATIEAINPEGNDRVSEAKGAAIESLKAMLATARQREADAAELDRLRRAEAARKAEEATQAEINRRAEARAAQAIKDAEAATLREERANRIAEDAKRQAAEAQARATKAEEEMRVERQRAASAPVAVAAPEPSATPELVIAAPPAPPAKAEQAKRPMFEVYGDALSVILEQGEAIKEALALVKPRAPEHPVVKKMEAAAAAEKRFMAKYKEANRDL